MKAQAIIFAALTTITIITGCASKPFYEAPVIVDISDSKVVVQLTHYSIGDFSTWENTADMQDVQREADRGCGQYNRRAELLSYGCAASAPSQWGWNRVCTATNYLFACQEQ